MSVGLQEGRIHPGTEHQQARRAARLAAVGAGSVGLAVIAGWWFDIGVLKSVLPGSIAMQPWTATGILLGACALGLATASRPDVRSAATLPAVAAAVVGGVPLFEHLSGYSLGTDTWLFPQSVLFAQTFAYPARGRPSQSACVILVALGAALLLAPRAKGSAGAAAFSMLATTALAVATMGVLEFILRLEPFEIVFGRNPLALHSALCFAALSGGTLCLRPDLGWVRVAARGGRSGWLAAMLLGMAALLLAFGAGKASGLWRTASIASNAHLQLEILLSSMKDAETGQRGYLLTGVEAYLAPYDAALRRIPGDLSAVRASLTTLGQSSPPSADLSTLVGEKLSELAETIQLRRTGDTGGALARVETNRGKATMDAIRTKVAALQDEAAEAGVRARQATALAAFGTILLVAIVLLTLAAVLRKQGRTDRELAEVQARQGELLATIALGNFMTRDLSGTIRYWAGGCERLYGWSAEEAAGRNAHDLLGTIFPVSLREVEAVLEQTGEWAGDLRQRTRDGRDLVVTANKVLRRAADGETAIILEVVTDVTAQRRAEAALEASQALLRVVIETTPGLIYAKDAKGRLILANGAVAALIGRPWTELEGKTDREVLGDASQGEAVMANDRRVMDRGTTQEMEEVIADAGGEPRVWLSTKTPMRDTDGTVIGLVGISVDITERKRMEERLQLMVHELNHRVKNTLATVQAIASQTLGGAERPAFAAFEGRLLALASVHDVLTRESWKDADLDDVVAGATAPLRATGGARLTVSGPSLRLRPAAAVVLSMALHELMTNATRFGAWSVETGRVSISWEIMRETEPRLRLVWSEHGGPPVRRPARRGFGMRLVERSLARDLNGVAVVAFETEGVTCTVDAPLRSVAASPRVLAFPKIAGSGGA